MITLTTEQAQQIEEALVKLCNAAEMITLDRGMLRSATYKGDKALTAIRSARANGQSEQEPVGVVEGSGEWGIAGVLVAGVPIGTKLYAAPVRTKDLTDAELDALWYGNTEGGWRGLFRAVIAADRENNK